MLFRSRKSVLREPSSRDAQIPTVCLAEKRRRQTLSSENAGKAIDGAAIPPQAPSAQYREIQWGSIARGQPEGWAAPEVGRQPFSKSSVARMLGCGRQLQCHRRSIARQTQSRYIHAPGQDQRQPECSLEPSLSPVSRDGQAGAWGVILTEIRGI